MHNLKGMYFPSKIILTQLSVIFFITQKICIQFIQEFLLLKNKMNFYIDKLVQKFALLTFTLAGTRVLFC